MKYYYIMNMAGEFLYFEGIKKSEEKSGCLILKTPESAFNYAVIDIKSGLAVRRFTKLSECKEYFEGVKFIDDLPEIVKARSSDYYKKACSKMEKFRHEVEGK
jgi:hypothetical protein